MAAERSAQREDGAAPEATPEERLALLAEAAGVVGWLDCGADGRAARADAGLARAFGLAPERAAAGAPLAEFLAAIEPADSCRARRALESWLAGDAPLSLEFRLSRPEGPPLWLALAGRACAPGCGGAPGLAVATDVTSRVASARRKTALHELGERLRDMDTVEKIAFGAAEVLASAIDATRAGFGVVDQANETVAVQPDWRAPGTASVAGVHRFRDYGTFVDDLKRGDLVVIGDVTTDPRTRDHADTLLQVGVRVLVDLPIIEQGRLVLVVFVHHDRPHDWSAEEIQFVSAVADRAQAAIARLRAEQRQQVLHAELAHRLKNNLATVQSIVNLTLRQAPDLKTGREILANRLTTLGRAHDLLVARPGEAAGLQAVVRSALEPLDGIRERIATEGPDVRVAASGSLALALMLHELATNALKYGALSVPEGRVDLAWRIERRGEEPVLDMSWRERDGPPVQAPKREGFGSRLIRDNVASATGGAVELDYRPEGVVCRFMAPLAALQHED